jgi:DNA-binding GntR family transcriptional regulator
MQPSRYSPGMTSNPLRYVSKADAVYAEVRRRILDGELAAGSSVNQEQFAAQLGVSTTPLREALRRLESEGFVRTVAHRDVVVAPLDRDELIALYEVREELDPLAASLAAKRHTEAERERLLAAAARLGTRGGDAVRANREFHAAIYQACHNPVLVELVDSLWDRADRYRRQVGMFARGADVRREHEAIVLAVLDRRAREAEKLMREHLRSGRAAIEAHLDRGGLLVG